MRRQLSNSIYGLLDYAAYPVGMLLVAPFILRNLGVAQYGIWTVTAAIVNIGSILASGFGDANTQRVALRRSVGQPRDVLRAVRASMGIHLVLGFVGALAIWCSAPSLALRLAPYDLTLQISCIWCIRVAALQTVLRALETVCISTQKAYERYGAAVRISILGRLLSLAAAAVLATRGQEVVTIVTAAAVVMAGALGFQMLGLRQLVGIPLTPSFEGPVSKDLLRFGAWTWILAAAGVVFGQADRLVGGASLGAAGIVSYALSAQLSQPVYGLTAAGLHFLFPYIASRQADKDRHELTKTVLLALAANAASVVVGAVSVLVLSGRVLHLLATDEIAQAGAELIPWVLAGPVILALSVTGSYAMVALGRVRTVATLNIAACVALVTFTAGLLQYRGVLAIAEGRILFALVTLGVYIPLWRELRSLRPSIEQLPTGELMERA